MASGGKTGGGPGPGTLYMASCDITRNNNYSEDFENHKCSISYAILIPGLGFVYFFCTKLVKQIFSNSLIVNGEKIEGN